MKKNRRGNGGNPSRKLGTSANIVEEDDCSFMIEDDKELAVEEVSSIMELSSIRVKVFDSGVTTHISPY